MVRLTPFGTLYPTIPCRISEYIEVPGKPTTNRGSTPTDYRRRHVWVDAELHSAGLGVVLADDPEVAACFFVYRALARPRVGCGLEPGRNVLI